MDVVEEADTQQEDKAVAEDTNFKHVTEPAISVMSVLDGDPSSQITADTNIKQPRSLAAIDDILVNKTQPETEEELVDAFDYENAENKEDDTPESAMGEDNDTEDLTSAQQNHTDPPEAEFLGEDKENTPTNDDGNERYVRQVVSQLPLSKIKKIMKMDPETKLVQNDSVLLVAFATELFIKALSTAAARVAVKNKRKTIKKEDIETCVQNLEYFEFLEDML